MQAPVSFPLFKDANSVIQSAQWLQYFTQLSVPVTANTILANGTTATTQSLGDTSNKVATDQFVANAIANISTPVISQGFVSSTLVSNQTQANWTQVSLPGGVPANANFVYGYMISSGGSGIQNAVASDSNGSGKIIGTVGDIGTTVSGMWRVPVGANSSIWWEGTNLIIVLSGYESY